MTATRREREPRDLTEASRDPLAFLPGVAEQLGYYVYALRDPRSNEIFYVGKGRGQRAYQHARHARRVDAASPKALKLARIREIHAAGRDVSVELIRHGLSEQDAFAVEAAIIDALRLAGFELTNIVSGQGAGHGWEPFEDLVVRYMAKPVVIPREHRVLLIRLRRDQWLAKDRSLYEKTRKWWVLGPRRLQAQWAFAVYEGIVRAVYRIDDWERPTQRDLKGDFRRKRRWAFRGDQDAAMEKRYFSGDVRRYLGAQGAQNPIKYVNC